MAGPTPSQLRTAASMLAEGATQAETSKVVGTTTRNLQRWKEAGLLDAADLQPASAVDTLRTVMLAPGTSTRDRIAAASAVGRIEALDDGTANDGPRIVYVNIGLGATDAEISEGFRIAAEHGAMTNVSFPGRPSMSAGEHAEVLAEIDEMMTEDELNLAQSNRSGAGLAAKFAANRERDEYTRPIGVLPE